MPPPPSPILPSLPSSLPPSLPSTPPPSLPPSLSLQVSKLCELPANDSVCSVSWSQRGTYLSLGTQV